MNARLLTAQAGRVRASDRDRDRALGLLRDHWLAGRLTLEEYEQRWDEAARACFVDDLRHSIRELPYPLPEHGLSGLTPAPPAAARRHDAPVTQGTAGASVVLGALSLLTIVGTFGLFFLLTLPASTCAWVLGRRARRGGGPDVRVAGTVGEVLGIAATVLGCLALTACAAIIAAV